MERKISTCQRTCSCKRKPSDDVVVPGLAISPAEMLKLNQQGIAVSSGNTNLAYESGHAATSWDIAPENRRGVDIADLWQLQETTSKKLSNLKKNQK